MTNAEARRYYSEHFKSPIEKIADVEVYQLLDDTIAAFVMISKKSHVVWREEYLVIDDKLHYTNSKLLYP